jgi:V8-like Glu-specific endopeptidase
MTRFGFPATLCLITAALAFGVVPNPAALASTAADSARTAAGSASTAAGSASTAAGSASTVTFSTAARAAAVRYWTPERLAAAAGPPRGAAKTGPPRGAAKAVTFAGVPTVGALFLSSSASENFCTASVVDSRGLNLLVTAAHCVDYGGGNNYGQHLVFIPGWHRGQRPYGVWPVRSITVTRAWNSAADINDDVAFLTVSPPAGRHQPIQRVTGGLKLGVNRGYRHSDVVPIGYDTSGGGLPVMCRTKSFYARADQQEFRCDGYTDGASGGPWILGFDRRTGTGTVIGVIGGYQQGGNLPWTGYSPYFTPAVEQLYQRAVSR